MTQRGKYPKYLWGCAAEDDYTGFPEIIMYFGGDEIFAAEAPEHEKTFQQCGAKDYAVCMWKLACFMGRE